MQFLLSEEDGNPFDDAGPELAVLALLHLEPATERTEEIASHDDGRDQSYFFGIQPQLIEGPLAELRHDCLDLTHDLRIRGTTRDLPVDEKGSRPGKQQAHKYRSGDRKSTRLNSSHVRISYAVFCL